MAWMWLTCSLILITPIYLYHKLPWIPRIQMATRIHDKIYGYSTAARSVSSELAADPTKSAKHISEKLYGGQHPAVVQLPQPHERTPASKEDIARARACGNWGTAEPSELFLQCFHDALCALNHDPLEGMVSPSLMGSTGTIPLTIIAPLPDIARHMSNLIVRAEREVFLATNFWIASDASRLITDAFLELSKRAGERGQRIVVKVMYDRGNIKQVLDNHQIMTVEQYTGAMVKLPSPAEIPNIDMEVQNFHRPMLGTFHAKYMVVDRKVAVVQSNNIQDNDNLEMMTQIEGPIVDSLYDTALLSWEKELKPALPCLDTPAVTLNWSSFDDPSFRALFQHTGNSVYNGTQLPNGGTPIMENENISIQNEFIPPPQHESFPNTEFGGDSVMHNRLAPTTENGGVSTTYNEGNSTIQNRTLDTPIMQDGNTSPTHNGNPPSSQKGDGTASLPMHLPGDPHYDSDIASEIRRLQSNLTPAQGESLLEPITRHLNLATKQIETKGNAPESSLAKTSPFSPMIPHAPHDRFPIALVNRAPFGAPNNTSLTVPQNQAWLSAIRHAKSSVFIQTPNLNASPLLPALLDAVRRGVEVVYYVCLGYNDAGELLPGQGGTNEMVASSLHSSLSGPEDAEAKKRLKIHYYVAKDMQEPIHNKFHKRSCHIKLLIADGHIGIQGNGNMDTQSWCHSMEVNVMIDSRTVCEEWLEGIARNQSKLSQPTTHIPITSRDSQV
jgi:phosphatidylserine/phosphatidylglycerophosphate/cardiolipin synthase-like enzyme